MRANSASENRALVRRGPRVSTSGRVEPFGVVAATPEDAANCRAQNCVAPLAGTFESALLGRESYITITLNNKKVSNLRQLSSVRMNRIVSIASARNRDAICHCGHHGRLSARAKGCVLMPALTFRGIAGSLRGARSRATGRAGQMRGLSHCFVASAK